MGGGASKNGKKRKGGKDAAVVLPPGLSRRRRLLLGTDSTEAQPFEKVKPFDQFTMAPDVNDPVFNRIPLAVADEFRSNARKVAARTDDGCLGVHAIELLGLDIGTTVEKDDKRGDLSRRLFEIGQVGRSIPIPVEVPDAATGTASASGAPPPATAAAAPASQAVSREKLTCYELLALFGTIRAGKRNDLLELLFCLFDWDEDDKVSIDDFKKTISCYLELEGASGLEGKDLADYKKLQADGTAAKQREDAALRVAELAIAKYGSDAMDLPPPEQTGAEPKAKASKPKDAKDKAAKDRSSKAAESEGESEAEAPADEIVHFDIKTTPPLGLTVDDSGKVTKVLKGQGKTLGVQVGWQVHQVNGEAYNSLRYKTALSEQATVEFKLAFKKVKRPAKTGGGCCGGKKQPAKKDSKAGKDDAKKPLIDETSDSEGAATSADEGKDRTKGDLVGGGETKTPDEKAQAPKSPDAKAKAKAAPTKKGGGCCLCGGSSKPVAKPSMKPLTFQQWSLWFNDNFGDLDLDKPCRKMGSPDMVEGVFNSTATPMPPSSQANPVQTLPPASAAKQDLGSLAQDVRTLLPQDMKSQEMAGPSGVAAKSPAPLPPPATGVRGFHDDNDIEEIDAGGAE